MSAADDEIRAAYEGLVVDTVIEELDRLRAENERLRARLAWCEELLEQTSTGERVLADAVADADEEIASLKAENARLRSLAEAWAIEGDYTDGEELHAVLANIITRLQQVATEKTREMERLRAALSDAIDFASEGWDPSRWWEYAPRVDRWRELAERKGRDK